MPCSFGPVRCAVRCMDYAARSSPCENVYHVILRSTSYEYEMTWPSMLHASARNTREDGGEVRRAFTNVTASEGERTVCERTRMHTHGTTYNIGLDEVYIVHEAEHFVSSKYINKWHGTRGRCARALACLASHESKRSRAPSDNVKFLFSLYTSSRSLGGALSRIPFAMELSRAGSVLRFAGSARREIFAQCSGQIIAAHIELLAVT